MKMMEKSSAGLMESRKLNVGKDSYWLDYLELLISVMIRVENCGDRDGLRRILY